jgi:mannose-6-phosphate isomerase-like protein (cupin superfamily)
MHLHKYKSNAFIVLSGSLTIEVKKNAYDLVDKTELNAGDMTTVRPNEKHRFVSGDSACVAYEIYYPEPLSEDIVRDDVGGPVDGEKYSLTTILSNYQRPVQTTVFNAD